MSFPINIADVDKDFLKSCCDMLGIPLELVSPTAGLEPRLELDPEDDWSRLKDFYPRAITDFYGSATPCIFKKGPEWPRSRFNNPRLLRAARPIYDHPIQPTWLKILEAIVDLLDSLQVKWNAVDPLAYANAGEATLICEFVITIAVLPRSLAYDAAVAAAGAVHEILVGAGFPDIEVAFIESVYRSQGRGPKLMGFNPTFLDMDDLPGLRKPFTPTLGLSIAPLKSPYYEGSGGIFLRLSSDEGDKRIGLLTCAHVSHPPPLFPNEAYTHQKKIRREEVVLLGIQAFDNTVSNIMQFLRGQVTSIHYWELDLNDIPTPEENEAKEITARRNWLAASIKTAKFKIKQADKLHTHVTKNFTTLESRVLGFVLHSAKIEVGAVDGFLYDWSVIQLDDDKINWDEFKGNQLFVGGNKTFLDWIQYMFPDQSGVFAPEGMLLPLKDHVPEAELRNPRDLDIHKTKTLLAVKNGHSTGTTFGRINGLESVTRNYHEHGISQRAFQFLVCGYDTSRDDKAIFSDAGDSGSCVVGRDGRLIGMLTGGRGATDDMTDKSYITPYYALKTAVEKIFSGCELLDVPSQVNDSIP
ncbi:hypothetical protein FB45DRAFT_425603 [Roridomyces roridus]|uniref:Uncharacterized protein n=1 Tax=Roridomyces roridus TaxID=1738132 RepID=A0AAD7C5F4_9AGAR|nr:hypothetical protein FB45DRAFT_425603 [Roridomyces roridus]